VALALSKKAGRPVKIVMSREEVFRGTGPTSGGVIEVKLGAKYDGTITGAELVLKFQAGAFAGSPAAPGCMCAFAMYDLDNVTITGYDVVSNRPKVAAYRAPGAPISTFGVESCIDELAREIGMDPLALRVKNAATDGTKGRARAHLDQYRLSRHGCGGQGAPQLQRPARPQPGARRRLRILTHADGDASRE
jgi:CO/xanthine dehydrogenase Mo-binding subunit